MNLSAVVLTRNEERNIARSLESVDFADEIIVIDDNSTDSTINIAEDLGAKVYIRSLNKNWGEQRNYGLEKAKGRWVLFLDADEYITNKLKNEIIQLVGNPLNKDSGYFLIRKDIIWDKQLKHGESGKKRLLRLAKKSAGQWARSVHEYWKIKGKTRELNGTIVHKPHQSIGEFIRQVDLYSGIHAKENSREGKRSSLVKIVIYPPAKFVYNYIIRLGFLDGTEGFLVVAMMSLHSFLAWSKLWLVQRQKQKIR